VSVTKSLILGCAVCLFAFCFVFPARTLAQTKSPAAPAQAHENRDQTLYSVKIYLLGSW
jgi:hypothetical protein